MKTALVPGSFDPPTVGHLNIIKRAAAMFDKVYVTIFINADKTPRFDLAERFEMLVAACKGLDNVICDTDDGMLADYCKDKGIQTVVKGARNAADFEYEVKMAHFNRERNPGLDTVILPAEAGLEGISSTALYEAIKSGRNYKSYLPDEVIDIAGCLLEKHNI